MNQRESLHRLESNLNNELISVDTYNYVYRQIFKQMDNRTEFEAEWIRILCEHETPVWGTDKTVYYYSTEQKYLFCAPTNPAWIPITCEGALLVRVYNFTTKNESEVVYYSEHWKFYVIEAHPITEGTSLFSSPENIAEIANKP